MSDADRVVTNEHLEANGRRFTSTTMLIVTASAYVVLFAAMWVPRFAGYEGWMFMYPVLLVLWVPVELASIATIVLGIIDTVSDDRVRQRRGWWVLAGGVVLVTLSLPLLWFGDVLRVPFTG